MMDSSIETKIQNGAIVRTKKENAKIVIFNFPFICVLSTDGLAMQHMHKSVEKFMNEKIHNYGGEVADFQNYLNDKFLFKMINDVTAHELSYEILAWVNKFRSADREFLKDFDWIVRNLDIREKLHAITLEHIGYSVNIQLPQQPRYVNFNFSVR